MRTHLVRPKEKKAMCGMRFPKEGLNKATHTHDNRLTPIPDLVTCLTCKAIYELNQDWYNKMSLR